MIFKGLLLMQKKKSQTKDSSLAIFNMCVHLKNIYINYLTYNLTKNACS